VIGIVRAVLMHGQNVNFASKSDALIELAKTVPDVKFSTAHTSDSPEKAVLDATYLISVTCKN
jgi:hypothetical protein